MILSQNTVEMLKNYSSINSNLVFTQGNTISTISEARNILATATIDNDIPTEFGIYDLSAFLGVIGLVDDPKMKINESHATISDSVGRTSIKYWFTDVEMLTSPTDTMINKAKEINDFEVSFTMDQDTMNKIKRAANTLGHTHMSVTADDGALAFTVFDPESSTSNTFTIQLAGRYETEDFNIVFSIQNMKILPGDYDVGLSSKLMSKWSHKDKNVNYWIALEKSSTYGA